jgi:hypothetical protein
LLVGCHALREEERELFEFARLSLVEDATRFAVSLVRLQAEDMGKANRERVRDLCVQILERHLGGEGGRGEPSPYSLDVSPAAVNGPGKQVRHVTLCVKINGREILYITAALPSSGGGPCQILALSSGCPWLPWRSGA